MLMNVSPYEVKSVVAHIFVIVEQAGTDSLDFRAAAFEFKRVIGAAFLNLDVLLIGGGADRDRCVIFDLDLEPGNRELRQLERCGVFDLDFQRIDGETVELSTNRSFKLDLRQRRHGDVVDEIGFRAIDVILRFDFKRAEPDLNLKLVDVLLRTRHADRSWFADGDNGVASTFNLNSRKRIHLKWGAIGPRLARSK